MHKKQNKKCTFKDPIIDRKGVRVFSTVECDCKSLAKGGLSSTLVAKAQRENTCIFSSAE